MRYLILPQGRRPLLFLLADLTVRGQHTARHPEFGSGVDQWLNSEDEIASFGFRVTKGGTAFERLLRRYTATPKLIFDLERWVRREVDDALAGYRRVSGMLKTLSDRQLWMLLEHLMTAYEITVRGVSIVRSLDTSGMTHLLEKPAVSENPDILAALCAPHDTSYLIREEIVFLKGLRATLTRRDLSALSTMNVRGIAAYCGSHARIHHFITRHAKKYDWISKGYYNEASRTAAYYYRQIADLLKKRSGISKRLDMLLARPRQVLRRRRRLYQQLKLTGEERGLLTILQHAAFLKDVYREHVAHVVPTVVSVLREVGRRRNIATTTLTTMLKKEVRACLFQGTTVDSRLLEKRRRRFVMVPDGHAVRTYYGKQADRVARRIDPIITGSGQREFHGRTAATGRATGKVRIIRGFREISSFRKGEVLVVNNTTPDFVPIMRKASAIVAEEGGITAHVAVVSREMGIPCVVGIPHIIFLLKNGDRVEVDANKGIVKKL